MNEYVKLAVVAAVAAGVAIAAQRVERKLNPSDGCCNGQCQPGVPAQPNVAPKPQWFNGPDGMQWLQDYDGRTYRLNKASRRYELWSATGQFWAPAALPPHLPVPYGMVGTVESK